MTLQYQENGSDQKWIRAISLRCLNGDLPVLNLPSDYPRPPVLKPDVNTSFFQLSKSLSTQL